jgi:hypothetical protein
MDLHLLCIILLVPARINNLGTVLLHNVKAYRSKAGSEDVGLLKQFSVGDGRRQYQR